METVLAFPCNSVENKMILHYCTDAKHVRKNLTHPFCDHRPNWQRTTCTANITISLSPIPFLLGWVLWADDVVGPSRKGPHTTFYFFTIDSQFACCFSLLLVAKNAFF